MPVRPRASRWWASSAPTSSPRSIRQPVSPGHRGGAAVGVGVVGHDEVGTRPRRRARARGPSRPAPRGWGSRRSGSPGRAPPAAHDLGRGEPGGLQHLHDRGAADAVQRRVDDAEVARTVGRQLGHRVEVVVDDVLAEHGAGSSRAASSPGGPPRRSAGRCRRRSAARSGCRRRGRPCSRCPAGGLWLAVTITPATHPSSRIANASTGRGQRARHHPRREPGAGHHLGGVAGEDVGVVAGVVADDDRARSTAGPAAPPRQVGGEAGGGPGHHHPVHPVRAGAQGAAQAGGAELQRAAEAVREIGGIAPGLHLGDHLLAARRGSRRRGPPRARRGRARAGRRRRESQQHASPRRRRPRRPRRSRRPRRPRRRRTCRP